MIGEGVLGAAWSHATEQRTAAQQKQAAAAKQQLDGRLILLCGALFLAQDVGRGGRAEVWRRRRWRRRWWMHLFYAAPADLIEVVQFSSLADAADVSHDAPACPAHTTNDTRTI